MNNKINRAAFIYLEPNYNTVGDVEMFAQCGTCRMWTGEETKRCTILGKDFEVRAEDTCGLYVNGPINTSNGVMKSAYPDEVGFYRGLVTCKRCSYYDKNYSICNLFARLDMIPGFETDPYEVSPNGCCNGFLPNYKTEFKLSDFK